MSTSAATADSRLKPDGSAHWYQCRNSFQESRDPQYLSFDPMRVVHKKKALPRHWGRLPGADRALVITDVSVTRHSRLRMKLLVFRSNRDLCRFWRLTMKSRLCRNTKGVVSSLTERVISFKGEEERHRMEVDPRYFAVMALINGYLTAEHITHESVHAGIAYNLRTRGVFDWPGAEDMEEENVAYPIGRIARYVADACRRAGLFDEVKPKRK